MVAFAEDKENTAPQAPISSFQKSKPRHRYSLATRGILKGYNRYDENHTVIGAMQVPLKPEDSGEPRHTSRRRVSFAPEATLHTIVTEPVAPVIERQPRRRETISFGPVVNIFSDTPVVAKPPSPDHFRNLTADLGDAMLEDSSDMEMEADNDSLESVKPGETVESEDGETMEFTDIALPVSEPPAEPTETADMDITEIAGSVQRIESEEKSGDGEGEGDGEDMSFTQIFTGNQNESRLSDHDSDEDRMTMEFTKPIGSILDREKSGSDDGMNSGNDRNDGNDSEDNDGEDMDITVQVGRIQQSNVAQEATELPFPAIEASGEAEADISAISAVSAVSDATDATMDMTRPHGGILFAPPSDDSRDNSEVSDMDITGPVPRGFTELQPLPRQLSPLRPKASIGRKSLGSPAKKSQPNGIPIGSRLESPIMAPQTTNELPATPQTSRKRTFSEITPNASHSLSSPAFRSAELFGPLRTAKSTDRRSVNSRDISASLKEKIGTLTPIKAAKEPKFSSDRLSFGFSGASNPTNGTASASTSVSASASATATTNTNRTATTGSSALTAAFTPLRSAQRRAKIQQGIALGQPQLAKLFAQAQRGKPADIPTATPSGTTYVNVSLRQFLDAAQVEFFDDLIIHERRQPGDSGQMPATEPPRVDPPSLFEHVAAAMKLTTADMYEFGCRELAENMKQGREQFAQLEEEVLEENPALIREYFQSSAAVQKNMDTQFKLMKAYARQQSKSVWYNWRYQLVNGLALEYGKHAAKLSEDVETLTAKAEAVRAERETVAQRYRTNRETLQRLAARKQEFEQFDLSELAELRAQLLELEAVVERKRAAREAQQAREQEISAEVAAQSVAVRELEAEVAQAKDLYERNKVFNAAQVQQLRGQLEWLERISGCRLVTGGAEDAESTVVRAEFRGLIVELNVASENVVLQSVDYTGNRPVLTVAARELHRKFLGLRENSESSESAGTADSVKFGPNEWENLVAQWTKAEKFSREISELGLHFPMKVSTSDNQVAVRFRVVSFSGSKFKANVEINFHPCKAFSAEFRDLLQKCKVSEVYNDGSAVGFTETVLSRFQNSVGIAVE